MKKVQKALALALGLALGAGVLVACGGNTDDGKKPDGPSKPVHEVPYWVAGDVAGVQQWDNPIEGRYFSKGETENTYVITLDLWKGDTFKIRFEGKGWDPPEGWQANYTNNFDETQKADPASKIIDGEGIGGSNFGVAEEGSYKLTLDLTGEEAVVSYEYKGPATVKQPKPCDYIWLNKESIGMELGTDSATFQIKVTLDPVDADEKDDIIYESDDEAVATVSETGVVTAVGAGSTKIIVQCGKVSEELTVTVAKNGEAPYADSVALDKTEVTLTVGTPITLEATVTPVAAEVFHGVTWTSSDPTVVKVENGKLIAVKPGTATVTASNGTGEKEKKATCEVTVPDGWYLFGKFNSELLPDGYGEWKNMTGDLSGVPGTIVFKQDETNADKYTLEGEFYRGDQIKILPISGPDQSWSNVIGMDNLVDANSKFANGGSGNIKFLDSAKYKFTLEKVADTSEGAEEGAKKWQLSYEIVKDIKDTTYESYDVEVHGTANSWGGAYEGKTATVTAAEQWKVEITLTVAEGETFQFRQQYSGKTNYIGKGQGVNGSNVDDEYFNNKDNNYQAKAAGTYKFTITLNEYGECESVSVVSVEA